MAKNALRRGPSFFVVLIATAICSFGQTAPSVKQQARDSACSNIVALAGNVNINCSSLTPTERKLIEGIPAVLNKILANQLDPAAVMAKLDEIGKDVKQLVPRRLSDKQMLDLNAAARKLCSSTFPMINVTASNGNQEAQRYAMDFVNALRHETGCKADLSLPIPGLRPDVAGTFIGVRDTNNIDPSALGLGRMLGSAGIVFAFAQVSPDFFPTDKFVLVIGAKD
ncbi:MAG: hypothetical protein ABSD96_10640 [Candidatus Korobacteraceae bacterium]